MKHKRAMFFLRYRHCRAEGRTRWHAFKSALDWAIRYPKKGWYDNK